ncbi:uncharacterized protein LOC113210278 [Frankliniella occidentalis]|uniref:Uncharacterized protein LOC113210278 n=1 Tax=Frankliniella occidentalis TaxID=133901 RepID=A0A9C6TN80_FRAOC|nr:uncharacterized protein LOC113210278 [Frankliniella occidentalis]
MAKTRRLSLVMALTALSAACCLGSPLAPELPVEAPARQSLQDVLASAPETFRVDVQQLDSGEHELGVRDEVRVGEAGATGDEKQLSPATQSFLSTLGTALGPIVGAIVGPLLSNIGQNLSAGSGAQAIAQLQQAAAAVAAQQQGAAASEAAPAPAHAATSSPPPATPAEVSVTPPPPPPRPARPGRPTARPGRPGARPSPAATTAAPSLPPKTSAPPKQSFDAFVLDVPGRGPFLFLMTPNVTAAEQTAAIQQAQQQAAQLLAVNGQSSPIGAVASLMGTVPTTPRPQVTKPTSVGPLPVRPFGTTPSPLPSYHSLIDTDDDQDQQQGGEEVAVADTEGENDHDVVEHVYLGEDATKEGDSDYSAQSFLERLFPEMT